MNFTPDCVLFVEVWLPWQMLAHMIMAVSFSSPWDGQMSSTINTPYLARSEFLMGNHANRKLDIWHRTSLTMWSFCLICSNSTVCFLQFIVGLSPFCLGDRRHNLQSTQISRSAMWWWWKTLKTSQNKNGRGIFFILLNLFSSCFALWLKSKSLSHPGASLSFWWHNTPWIKETQKGKGRRKEITIKSHKVSVKNLFY